MSDDRALLLAFCEHVAKLANMVVVSDEAPAIMVVVSDEAPAIIDAFLAARAQPEAPQPPDVSCVSVYTAPMDDVSDCSCPVYAAPFEEGGELSDIPCALPVEATVPGRKA